MFQAVSPKVDVQKLEKDQLEYWRSNRIFERSMEERTDRPVYVTYEGPPTVNGTPGVHHVLARAFKDIFPRYKTMRGYYALRKGGWDTHGLPVEIAIEKELGFTHKRQIEEYGIAEFNEKCRASVMRNIATWERFTERMAYWTDLDNAYVTFTNDYIESIWYILKQFWDKNLLYKGLKVIPYCARCGTPLSSHEVALGYKDVKDPSVYVRFPLRDKPGIYFLVWTTTPWTLPANVALAVGENVEYVQVEGPTADGESTEQLILAADLMPRALVHPENYRVQRRFKGKELLGQHYQPLYTYLPVEQNYAYVVAGDFVSTDDGTGIVHIAPAFGVDDMAVGKAHDLPVLQTVSAEGRFIEAVSDFKGMWVKDADPEIIVDLKRRGLMYKSEKHEHTYPFCWRCDTPLLYFARDSWFVNTTSCRETMMALNQTINWVPGHVREGRFGNWLEELKDWALGRERYWGTTLPIWGDDTTGEMLCVGSVAELSLLAGRDLTGLDLHRPYVDEITFPNPTGKGGMMRRVPEVIDVWFDSGAMPLAQWGYPAHNSEMFEQQFPADYICEAVDQTRGWFYTLHAISSMLFETVSYKNVISLGLILDEEGQKMSKSKGNVVDPWDIFNTHGADVFRWYLYVSGPPGEPRRFSKKLVGEVMNQFWSTLWNTYSFFVTYANLAGWTPQTAVAPAAEREVMDRWVLAELHQLTRDVTEAFDAYDVPGATRPVQAFVENLSNWYLRLSRRRFWDENPEAFATLYECLVTVARLIAPTMPFLSDALYRNLVLSVESGAADSVHLADWPPYNAALIDTDILREMRLTQRLVSLGRAARDNNIVDGKKSPIGVRQPLRKVMYATREADEAQVVLKMTDLIKSELNVKQVEVLSGASDFVNYALNPLPKFLGKKFGQDFPKVQKALREGAAVDVRQWAQTLLAGRSVTVEVEGVQYEVTPEEVEVRQLAAEGYAVAEETGYLAAIDIQLSEDLIMEGMAREVVRRIQNMRKDADFEVDDRIAIQYTASERLALAIAQFADYIRTETLGDSLEQGHVNGSTQPETFEIDTETLSVSIQRLGK